MGSTQGHDRGAWPPDLFPEDWTLLPLNVIFLDSPNHPWLTIGEYSQGPFFMVLPAGNDVPPLLVLKDHSTNHEVFDRAQKAGMLNR